MLLLVFYYFIFRFSLSLSRFQPIFVSFDAFSSLLYHCFKAMLLVGINPNWASLDDCQSTIDQQLADSYSIIII